LLIALMVSPTDGCLSLMSISGSVEAVTAITPRGVEETDCFCRLNKVTDDIGLPSLRLKEIFFRISGINPLMKIITLHQDTRA
jgi:hypothetical protein